MTLTLARAGFSSTVQDLGRIGSRQMGVSLSGALDPHALRISNLLTANEEGAAGLEITSGPVRLRVADSRLIAWGGGDYEVTINGRQISPGRPIVLKPGEELSATGPKRGCRGWVAISGGIDVPPVLGSRSTDLRAQFGGQEGRALRDGDVLTLGRNSKQAEDWIRKFESGVTVHWTAPFEWVSPARAGATLRVVRGADWGRFDETAQQQFLGRAFTVLPASDRMGARLQGPELSRNDRGDLFSEAVAPGTVQVPPDGQPIILLGDCQTVGGYPKIAHVITVDLPVAAQLRAGDNVRFGQVPLAEAHRLLAEREDHLAQFRTGLSLR